METIKDEIATVSRDSGGGIEQPAIPSSIPQDPYEKVERRLSEEEMHSSAVQKLLLSENSKKDREIEKLNELVEKYHQRDKEAAVLEEKLKSSTRSEVLYTVCETGGSALAGVSGLFWDNQGWIFLAIGILFIIGGLLFKFWKR